MALSPPAHPSYATTFFDQLHLDGRIASSDVEELEEERALMDPEKYWSTQVSLVKVRALPEEEWMDQSIVDMTKGSRRRRMSITASTDGGRKATPTTPLPERSESAASFPQFTSSTIASAREDACAREHTYKWNASCGNTETVASSPPLPAHRSNPHTPTTSMHFGDDISDLEDTAMQTHSATSSVPSFMLNKAGHAQASPTPSPSPSPLPLPSPSTSPLSAAVSEPLEYAPVRAFRNRTAAQLNPYSIENAKYTRTLLKNGWQGAVVAGLRGVEESESQMRRRKELGESLPKDNLQGWLEYEAGQQVAYKDESGQKRSWESDEDSLDGDDILEREARKERRIPLDSMNQKRALGKGNGRLQRDSEERDLPARLNHQYHSKFINGVDPKESTRMDTESARFKHATKRKRPPATFGQDRPRKKIAIDASEDSDGAVVSANSPTSSSSSASYSVLPRRLSKVDMLNPTLKARPSKHLHRPTRVTDQQNPLEALILALPNPSRSDSSSHSSSPEETSPAMASSSDLDVVAAVKPSKTKLGGKRKKALLSMMPKSFMIKAQADLKKMEQEKLEGYLSDSEQGSGDEAEVASSSQPEKGRGRIKIVPRDSSGPLQFKNASVFTDESGDDSQQSAGDATSQEDFDSVCTWASAFAPRRKVAGGEDIVDRYLRYAKGNSRPQRPRRKRSGSRKTRKTTGLPPRQPLLETSNRGLNGPSHPPLHSSRPPAKLIPLNTGQAIFSLWTTKTIPIESRNSLRKNPQQPRAPVTNTDAESWASFGKFSEDFEIKRLPSGIRFPESSIVGSGYLQRLFAPKESIPPYRICHPFGLELNSTMSLIKLETLLPLLCDSVFTAFIDGRNQDYSFDDTFRFLGNYLSEWSPSDSEATIKTFSRNISSELDRLLDRIESALPTYDQLNAETKVLRLSLVWYLVDIECRVLSLDDTQPSPSSRLPRLITSLVVDLLSHGPENTVRALKCPPTIEEGDVVLEDASAEVWLALISLALSTNAAVESFTEENLWQIVYIEVLRRIPKEMLGSPIAAETLAYVAMMLGAISQFSSSGVSTSQPRLSAGWPLFLRGLELIQTSTFTSSDPGVSSTALARRDRYLWILFARCLVLVDRWNWKVDVKGDVIPKLFDVLNSRRLQNLTIESTAEFPSFLQDLDKITATVFSREEDTTTFATFLRLLISAATSLPAEPANEKRRQLVRLFTRLSPMTSGPWNRHSAELSLDTSILINHYSLFIAFAAVHPSSTAQRLHQARRLVVFSEVDERARRTTLRAVLYFALLYRYHNLPLAPVLEWLASIVSSLRSEYSELEKTQRQARSKTKVLSGAKDEEVALWNVAVLTVMALRSIQHIMKCAEKRLEGPQYPDIDLLHASWTSNLLESTLGLDPLVGVELVSTIDCFLGVRGQARATERRFAGDSQDEYGLMDPCDWGASPHEDGSGLQGSTEPSSVVDTFAQKDKAFAQWIKVQLAPSLYRLMSSIYINDYSNRVQPSIDERNTLAELVVGCWTKCLAIMIENNEGSWQPFLQYGDGSWRRISHPTGRRDIALLLAIEILTQDGNAQSVYPNEFVEIWVQSLVAFRLSRQHNLTELLLKTPGEGSALLSNLHHISASNPMYTLEMLQRQRVALLAGSPHHLLDHMIHTEIADVFPGFISNCASALSTPSTAGSKDAPIATLNYLRGLVLAMRDNLGTIPDASNREQYASLCRAILDELERHPSIPTKNIPDMLLLKASVSI